MNNNHRDHSFHKNEIDIAIMRKFNCLIDYTANAALEATAYMSTLRKNIFDSHNYSIEERQLYDDIFRFDAFEKIADVSSPERYWSYVFGVQSKSFYSEFTSRFGFLETKPYFDELFNNLIGAFVYDLPLDIEKYLEHEDIYKWQLLYEKHYKVVPEINHARIITSIKIDMFVP